MPSALQVRIADRSTIESTTTAPGSADLDEEPPESPSPAQSKKSPPNATIPKTQDEEIHRHLCLLL